MPPTTSPPSSLFSDNDSSLTSYLSFGDQHQQQPSEMEEAQTQTDDSLSVLDSSRTSLTSSSYGKTFSSRLPIFDDEDPESSESESVIDRLTRRVGRLFLMQQERHDRGTQTVKDPLTSETEKLAFDTVFFAIGKRKSNSGDDVARCLRQSVTQMLERHTIVFSSMMTRLHVDRNSNLRIGFNQLADELFVGNQVSWAKIVALFAFGARMAQHVHSQGEDELVYDIATLLGQFAVEKLTPFLKANGGWSTLCDVFPVESDYESTIWKSLIFTGMGLTAIATILAFHR